MSDNPLAGRQQDICGDEPAGSGIVVAALQIVPLGLIVVDVTSVAERLIGSQCSYQAARCGNDLSPTVIGVFYHGIAASVNQLNDVILRVPEVVIGGEARSVVRGIVHSNDVTARVIREAQDFSAAARSDLHADQHGAAVVALCQICVMFPFVPKVLSRRRSSAPINLLLFSLR